jgi:hypothetical protein
LKKILRYLSVKQLMEDIADLNGVMSVRRFVLSTMLAGVAVYGACLLYRINYIAALFVMILAVIMIPGLVRNILKHHFFFRIAKCNDIHNL